MCKVIAGKKTPIISPEQADIFPVFHDLFIIFPASLH